MVTRIVPFTLVLLIKERLILEARSSNTLLPKRLIPATWWPVSCSVSGGHCTLAAEGDSLPVCAADDRFGSSADLEMD